MDEEDGVNYMLDEMDLPNYDSVEAVLGMEGMTSKKRKSYLKINVIKNAEFKRNQFKGYKGQVSKGEINDAQKQSEYKRIDNARIIVTNARAKFET